MKKEVISIVMAGILAVGACGCKKSEEKDRAGSGKLPSAESQEMEEASGDKGNEGVSVDLPSGDEDTDDATAPGKEKTDATTDKADPTSDPAVGEKAELSADRLVFTYEQSNHAWGSQQVTYLFFGDGRIYLCSNDAFAYAFGGPITTMSDELQAKIDLLLRLEPAATVDPKAVYDLYYFADQVDPNANVEKEHVMYDYGQKTLYYWAEDGSKVICKSEGDNNYIIDDPNISQVETLWTTVLMKMKAGTDYQKMSVYGSSDLPMTTIQCGYFELPEGSSGNYIFKNYDDLKTFAEKNGIRLTGMDLFEKEENREKPLFVQFDLFNTLGHERSYDAAVIKDGTFYFLPSEKCKDPSVGDAVGQALDGFMTVCAFGDQNNLSKNQYKTLGGELWEVYDPAGA